MHIVTHIDIDAPAERVWDVLARFSEYDEWNPFMSRVSGRLEPGAPLSFVANVGGREMKLDVEVLAAEPRRELRWRGPRSKLLSRAVSGEHYFRLEPLDGGGTRLTHGERFRGPLARAVWSRLEPALERAYVAVNTSLKERAERP